MQPAVVQMTEPPNGRVPFDSSNSEVIRTTVVGHSLSFSTPYCSFPRLSLLPTACHSRLTCYPSGNLHAIPRVRLKRVGLPPPFSLYQSFPNVSPPAVSAVAPPIRNECNANSSGDFATTFLPAWRNRPYLTTLTELSHPYEARGA